MTSKERVCGAHSPFGIRIQLIQRENHQYLQEFLEQHFPGIAWNFAYYQAGASQDASAPASEKGGAGPRQRWVPGPGTECLGQTASQPDNIVESRAWLTTLSVASYWTPDFPVRNPGAPRDAGRAPCDLGRVLAAPPSSPRLAPLPVWAESGSVGGSAGPAQGGPGGG